MLKYVARTFILLTVINALLLYMHYAEAGSAIAVGGEKYTYSQEIEVTNRPDGIYVRHHFKGLAAVQQEIIWPEMSTKRSCYLQDANACSRLNEEATVFLEGDADRQSIMYMIPKDKPMQQTMLLKNIFVTLENSEPTTGLFHLTDEMGLGGLWVNGFKLIGNEKLDLIDYSLFSGYGELGDLYWQKKELPLAYTGDRLAVFGTGMDLEAIQEVDAELLLVDAIHSTLVIDNEMPPVVSKHFSITSEAGVEKAANLFYTNKINERFLISQQDRLIAETITSLLLNKGIGMEKTLAVYEELTQHLTEPELKQIVEKVSLITDEAVDASVMDELVQEVTGYRTTFFTRNNEAETSLYPFLLEDPRTLYIDGNESVDAAIIYRDGKKLYPATAITRALGFEVRSNEQSLYIEGAGRNFRFPLKELFYVYNERKYNVMSVPFEKIGDEYYFEEAPFIRIFILGIEQTAEAIKITPRVQFEEKEAE